MGSPRSSTQTSPTRSGGRASRSTTTSPLASWRPSIYQEALEIEFGLRGMPFTPHPPLKLFYKGRQLAKTYEPDFFCYDKIILELKAVSELCEEHEAQLHNYLKATGCKLGLLVNFGHTPLQIKRIVR